MNAFLMYRDRDFDLSEPLPANEVELTQDLELITLFDAMAHGDRFLFDVARRAILLSLTDPEAIIYRQQVLDDCLANPEVVRAIYDVAIAAIEDERKVYFILSRNSPDVILHRSVEVMELYLVELRRLRWLADENAALFRSPGFRRFFAMIMSELDDAYLQSVDDHLKELRFRHGVLISAEIGKNNKGTHYVLRQSPEPGWMERLSLSSGPGYSFHIADRDENGFKALAELKGRGINMVANALGQSADHIRNFFALLRVELAFHIGCLNLHEGLMAKGEALCFPEPVAADQTALTTRGLYDPALSLHVQPRVVGNDVDADGKRLIMITGANQGGKSTFLRSLGVAQLMMQAGMLVAAESFRANVCTGVFTHYKREEDAGMESGKLDEELSRMSNIADQITPNGLLFCNESFAATNEREGSEIARQVVRAMMETGIKVIFVTHLFDLAHGFYRQGLETTLFLRAERRSDGQRTFHIVAGEPLPTSYGEDSYRRIFGAGSSVATATVSAGR